MLLLSKQSAFDKIVFQKEKDIEYLEENIQQSIDNLISETLFLANYTESCISNYPNNYNSLLEETYLQFALSNTYLDQIRFIDNDGYEQVRINHSGIKPQIVSKSSLQNKASRYYFKQTIKLNRNQVFLSPIDLNVEHGKIEEPHKPTLRVCIPIYDNSENNTGIVVLNYLANQFLLTFDRLNRGSIGKNIMVNKESYYLKGLTPESEWGFMFKDKETPKFNLDFILAANYIEKHSSGIYESDKGIFLFRTVEIDKEHVYTVKQFRKGLTGRERLNEILAIDPMYYIISFVPKHEINQLVFKEFSPWLKFIGLSFLPFIALIWFLAQFIHLKQKADVFLEQKALKLRSNIKHLALINESIAEKNIDAEQQNDKIKKLNEAISKAKQDHDIISRYLQLENTVEGNSVANYIKKDLSNLFGFSELIGSSSKKHIADKKDKISELLLLSADNANTIMQIITQWSQNDIDKLVFKPEAFDLRIVLNDIIYLCSAESKAKGIQLQSSVIKPIFVYADISMIGVMLKTLMQKVLKYATPNNDVFISVNRVTQHEYITLNVRFKSNNLNAENINSLFACENHLKNTKVDTYSLCQEFVERHNSRIIIESETSDSIKLSFELKRWFPENN